jgi:hypothetical protein
MFSLKTTLQDLAALPPMPPTYSEEVALGIEPAPRTVYPNGHLPSSFDATKGIRSLFPAGENVKLSSLSQYLYAQSGTTSVSGCTGTFYVRADGAGNWALVAVVSGSPWQLGVGFVFMFSNDGNGHGITSTAKQGPDLAFNDAWSVVAQGNDPWIRANWLQLFSNGVWLYLSEATGLNNLPPASNAATDHGFAGLTQLATNFGDPSWWPSTTPGEWFAVWGDLGP